MSDGRMRRRSLIKRRLRPFLYGVVVVAVWLLTTFLNLLVIQQAAIDLIPVAANTSDGYIPATPVPVTIGTTPGVPVSNVLCTQHERLQRIEDVCERYSHRHATHTSLDAMPDRAIKKLAQEFFVVPHFQVLACLNWKTGSSTWSTILMNNSHAQPLPDMSKIKYEQELGALRKAGRLRKLNDYTVAEIRQIFRTYWKFTTVRHPLDRLVSAYTDKLVMQKEYYKKLGPKIMTFIRGKNVSKELLKSGKGVTFKEFLLYISKGGQDIFGKEDGGHWHSLIDRCQPCAVSYDYIVRTETMHHDASHIVNRKLLGRGLRLKTKARRKAVIGHHSEFGMKLKEYKQIPGELFEKIAQRYKRDMYMYGYNFTRLPDGQVLTACSSGCNNEKSCC